MPEQAIRPLVVLTRPQGRNESLAACLHDHGLPVLELPALAICPLPIDAAQFPLPQDYDLVVFVSANAASLYLQQFARHAGALWPASTLAATVGQASAKPLRDAGILSEGCLLHPPPQAPQDSETLWSMLQATRKSFKRVLVVRGESGREWLGGQFELAGAYVRRFAIYGRRRAVWPVSQQAALLAGLEGGQPMIALFTSSESIQAFNENLAALGVGAGPDGQRFWRNARFVVIHERIASRLQSLIGTAPGEASRQMVKVCLPEDKAIFQAVISLASL